MVCATYFGSSQHPPSPAVMAQQHGRFVTWDMIPPVWFYTREQERVWLREMAAYYPGMSPRSLERHVAIELPDCPPAREYQEAFRSASLVCDNLVPVLITDRGQWESRKEQMVEVLGRLLARVPPLCPAAPNVVATATVKAD